MEGIGGSVTQMIDGWKDSKHEGNKQVERRSDGLSGWGTKGRPNPLQYSPIKCNKEIEESNKKKSSVNLTTHTVYVVPRESIFFFW